MEGFADSPEYLWLILPILLLIGLEALWRRRPLWLILPRLVWVAGIILLLLDWTWLSSKELSQPGTVYLVYDRSDSVSLLPERKLRLQEFLLEAEEWSKENKQPLELYSIGEFTQKTSLDNLDFGSHQTQIGDLDQIVKSEDANLILLSDGNWTDRIRMDRPVFSINVTEDPEQDIWVEKVQPVMTAFLKNRLLIPVVVGQKNLEGERVRVRLRRGRELVAEQELSLEEDENFIELSYFPEKMGEEILTLELQSESEEISEINNFASIRVRTVRDKIRILHVNGKPSLDLKAWRLFLTNQPDVDLVSFYILRSLNDDPQARNDELSLIPFPYDELFTTELEKFDIVILQNFNFQLYFQPFYLVNLARFIKGGGALLIFGGDQSFQKYRGSPVAPLLPFSYVALGDYEQVSQEARAVSSHPLVEGLSWMFSGRSWSGRHQIDSKAEATDLVVYEDQTPMVSIYEAGEGRVMAINSDESWRLQFEPQDEFAPLSRFARRVLQYLTFDPEMEPEKLISGPWVVGEEVSLKLAGAQAASWRIYSVFDQELQFSAEATNEINFFIEKPGVYEVEVSGQPESFLFETEQKLWQNEWKRLVANQENLESISRRSGGKYFSYADRASVFDEPLSGQQIISADLMPWSRASKFWSWLCLLAILAALGIDFFFRKKFQWDA